MPVRKQGGESNHFIDGQEVPVTMGFTHRPARKNAEAHRALELLEDYHAKLTRPQDKQLRLAIERVIRIFKSRLFQALLVPYTREWSLIATPYPLMLIIFMYIYFVLYAGPRYMKNRPPYELRTFILIYDVIQILANLWFVKEHISAGWSTETVWSGIFYMNNNCVTGRKLPLNTIKLFDMVWWLGFLKLFDFVETCIFVLRKKQNQVSSLHVYHHVSNLTFLWYYLKYLLDERATFVSLFNCAVHVIMYIYYFIAGWSPDLQRLISPVKPFITKLQMVQFIVMIAVIVPPILNPNCELQRASAIIFIGNLLVFLYLFNDFYKKSYTSKQKNK